MAAEIFVLETDYTINYTTSKPVPIPEIIDSLQSLEKMIKRTPAFIEKAYNGIEIIDVEVFVDSLQAGSLFEKFTIRYVFKGQDNYDNFKEAVAKVLDDSSGVRTVVALGVGALTTLGLVAALSPGGESKHFEAYNNTIINVGADVNFTADDINTVLKATPNKKQLAKDAVNVVSPAKTDPESTIEVSGLSGLTMSKAYLQDAPDEYKAPIPDEKHEHFTNTTVMIYASDRDKLTTGWAGIVPGVTEKRIPFVLGDGLDPKKLHGRTKIKADIVVTSKYDKKKRAHTARSVEIQGVN